MSRSACFDTAEADLAFDDYQPLTSWADLVEEADEAEACDPPVIPPWAASDLTEAAKHREPSPYKRGREIRELYISVLVFFSHSIVTSMLCYL